jgi:hypothetical protein
MVTRPEPDDDDDDDDDEGFCEGIPPESDVVDFDLSAAASSSFL